MIDLNELALFAAVVTHGSFSSAARVLGIPKSRISRHVAELEKQLGVRLLQRSTRVVRATEVGAAFFAHCEAMMRAARTAIEVAEQASERPSGRLRVSCPIGVTHIFLAPILGRFLRAHPDIRMELEMTNRRVDVIGEGFDVALRIRTALDDSNLVVRQFGLSEQALVASPSFVAERGPFPSAASLMKVVGIGPGGDDRSRWQVTSPDGADAEIEYTPALVTDDVHLAQQMALDGVGVAQVPMNLAGPEIEGGRLVHLLPDHRLTAHRLHAVFPSRRGLVPAVRAFIEFLAAELPIN